MKRKVGKTPDKKSYTNVVNNVFDELGLSEVDQNLLIEFYTGNSDINSLSIKYNMSIENITNKVNELANLIRNNNYVNEVREERNLKGR